MTNLLKCLLVTILSLCSTFASGQELTMYSGFLGNNYYQDHNQISKPDFEYLLSKIPESHSYWKDYKRRNLVGDVLTVIGSASIINYFLQDTRNRSSLYIVGGVAFLLGGVVLEFSAENSRRDALISYNFYVEKMETTDVNIRMGITENGLGIVASF